MAAELLAMFARAQWCSRLTMQHGWPALLLLTDAMVTKLNEMYPCAMF